jgi:hypothetical protein
MLKAGEPPAQVFIGFQHHAATFAGRHCGDRLRFGGCERLDFAHGSKDERRNSTGGELAQAPRFAGTGLATAGCKPRRCGSLSPFQL